jgi:putative DNA primase/helicase
MAEYLRDYSAGNHCHFSGLGWLHWTGKFWKLDEGEVRISLCAKDALLSRRSLIEREAGQAAAAALAAPPPGQTPGQAADAARKEVLKKMKHVSTCETGSGFSAMLKFAAIMLSVSGMDIAPHLLNTPDGTYDMDAGRLREHRREDLITKITVGGYFQRRDIGAIEEVTAFESFLYSILPDESERMYVQVLFGLALYGTIKERILPVFYGFGFNGKSTLLEALRYAAGSYGVTLASRTLLTSSAGSHTTELTDLRGARIALFSETDTGQTLNASLIKRLTTPGQLTARRMRRNDMTWEQSHTCFMDTNFLPQVNGSDKAMFDRIRVLKFTQDVESRKDPHMADKLEAAASAIITWGLDGWRIYCRNGLWLPQGVQDATYQYREESNNVQIWLDSNTERGSKDRELRVQLYANYKFWSENLGEKPLRCADFYSYLVSVGYEKVMVKGKRYIKGIRLQGGLVPDTVAGLFEDAAG